MNTAAAINSGLQNTTNALAYGAGNGWFGGSRTPQPMSGGTDTFTGIGPYRGVAGSQTPYVRPTF
jgi:hypothetical protein